MHVQWIVDERPGVSLDQDWAPSIASNRYRALLPATGLRTLGHEVEFVPMETWAASFDAGQRPDAVMVGKLVPTSDEARFRRVSSSVQDAAQRAVNAGVRVVCDFNDDHFDRPVLGAYWQAMARIASACTVGSVPMATTVEKWATGPVAVVGDPLAAPSAAPEVFCAPAGWPELGPPLLPGQPAPRLRLAWFGNYNNWPALKSWEPALGELSETQPFSLHLVGQPTPGVENFLENFNRKYLPRAMVEFTPWNEAEQWRIVQRSHIVLLPSDPADPKKRVKTGNRLTDAIHIGRYVVASPLPSYLKYADYCALVDSPLEAIKAYLKDPQAALRKIEAGQAAVREDCSLTAIAARWAQVLEGNVPAENPPQGRRSAQA